MKQGMKSLTDLAMELDRQRDAKRDFIVDTRQVLVEVIEETEAQQENARKLQMVLPIEDGRKAFPVNRHALRQIGERLQIPAKYVDRLEQDHPDMLAYNINGLFNREPEKRMIRTMDGATRAFLSDRYRIMDNFDLAQAVLPVLMQHGASVTSCDITETKMYIKAVREDMIETLPPPPGAEMGRGHTFFIEQIQAGICIGNSEIGAGKFYVQPASFTKRCTNYAIFNDMSFGKIHLGRKQGGGDFDTNVWEILSDETKAVSDQALFAQVKDLVTASMDGIIFKKIVDQLKEAREDKISGNLQKVVEVSQKKFGLSDKETGGILQHLIEGGDLSRYGMHAAVTRFSQEVDDYDRATDLEALGGKIIELPKSEWTDIAKAA